MEEKGRGHPPPDSGPQRPRDCAGRVHWSFGGTSAPGAPATRDGFGAQKLHRPAQPERSRRIARVTSNAKAPHALVARHLHDEGPDLLAHRGHLDRAPRGPERSRRQAAPARKGRGSTVSERLFTSRTRNWLRTVSPSMIVGRADHARGGQHGGPDPGDAPAGHRRPDEQEDAVDHHARTDPARGSAPRARRASRTGPGPGLRPIRAITSSQASMQAAQPMHSSCRPWRMSIPVGQTLTHRSQSTQSPTPAMSGLAARLAARPVVPDDQRVVVGERRLEAPVGADHDAELLAKPREVEIDDAGGGGDEHERAPVLRRGVPHHGPDRRESRRSRRGIGGRSPPREEVDRVLGGPAQDLRRGPRGAGQEPGAAPRRPRSSARPSGTRGRGTRSAGRPSRTRCAPGAP